MLRDLSLLLCFCKTWRLLSFGREKPRGPLHARHHLLLRTQPPLARFSQPPQPSPEQQQQLETTTMGSDPIASTRATARALPPPPPRVMFQSLTGKPLQGLTMIDLNDLGWLVDQNLKELAQRNPVPVPPTPAAVPAAGDHALNLNMHATMERQAFGLSNMGNTMQRPSWFTDMMNPNEQMGFGAVAEVLPFGDQYHHGHGLKTTGGCDDDEAVMRWRKKKKSVSACLASLLISLITGLNQAQRPLDLSDVRDSGRERDRERGRAVGVLIEFPSWYFRDNRADNVL